MGAYLVRRLVTLPLLLLGISAVSFALLNLAPGDPAEIVLRQRNPAQLPSAAEVAAMRIELGLDAPLPVQYARWVSGALAGDMGQSYVTEQPVAAQMARRTVPTALLTAAALTLALLVAVPMGILSAPPARRRRGHRRPAGGAGGRSGAVLRPGLRADYSVRGETVVAAGPGLRFACPGRASGPRAVPGADGSADAADPGQYAGNPGAGLHPNGAGQGTG